ncbi:MAG: hypothetical protein IKI83_05870 [Prevotella sp.]|nr:hypothetical protein [Prevotella sp.]
MNKTKPLFKKMWMLLAFLFCSVVSANAANITYSLTTHVDGRTMTATARNLRAGASLENGMPQALWRGYTTYKYYSDAALTQEITTVPSSDASVYVDYEFNPPFKMSTANETNWNYITNNAAGQGVQYLYFSENDLNAREPFSTMAPNRNGELEIVKRPGDVNSKGLHALENAHWALYGDAYSLNLKFNDVRNVATNEFMVPTRVNVEGVVWGPGIGNETQPGWQLYINDALNGSFSLGMPSDNDIDYLLNQFDKNTYIAINSIKSSWFHQTYVERSAQNHITGDAQDLAEYVQGYAFFAIPVEEPEPEPTTTFERTFTLNTWMTLVLPDYNLLAQNGVYGRFLDYVAVESHENAVDGYHWNCDLKFEEVGPNDLIPNRPYLFLPERIAGADNDARKKVLFSILESELGTPLTVSHVDPNEPDATISMYGTYEDFELVPCEPQDPKGYKYIYFYFGNPAEGEYNFYTVEKNVTIAPTICYFDIKATKNAQNAPTIGGFGAKFSFFEGTNAINNIEGVKTGADKVYNLNGQQVQGNLQKGIYIVNGKKVLVK